MQVTGAVRKVSLAQRWTFLLERAGDENRRSIHVRLTQGHEKKGEVICFKHSVLFQEGFHLAEIKGLRKGNMEIKLQR